MSKAKKKKRSYLKKKEQYNRKEEWLYHLLLGLWMLGIFILSSIEGSDEPHYSLKVFIERKAAHIFEFFVLSYLLYKVLGFYKLNFKRRLVLVFLPSLLYAVLDEFHQLFVFGREGKSLDVGVDVIGILSFLMLVYFSESKDNES